MYLSVLEVWFGDLCILSCLFICLEILDWLPDTANFILLVVGWLNTSWTSLWVSFAYSAWQSWWEQAIFLACLSSGHCSRPHRHTLVSVLSRLDQSPLQVLGVLSPLLCSESLPGFSSSQIRVWALRGFSSVIWNLSADSKLGQPSGSSSLPVSGPLSFVAWWQCLENSCFVCLFFVCFRQRLNLVFPTQCWLEAGVSC
jgi:hypothetical protein